MNEDRNPGMKHFDALPIEQKLAEAADYWENHFRGYSAVPSYVACFREAATEINRLKSVTLVTEGGRSYRAETMEFARAMLDDKEAFGLAMVTILRDELRSGKNILVISPMNGHCICGALLWFQSERDSGYCQKCAPKASALSSTP